MGTTWKSSLPLLFPFPFSSVFINFSHARILIPRPSAWTAHASAWGEDFFGRLEHRVADGQHQGSRAVEIAISDVSGSHSQRRKLFIAVPSPGGEGQDEGGLKTNLTSSLTQTLSPRRGLTPCAVSFEELATGLAGRSADKTESVIPSPGGEGQDEGGVKTHFSSAPFFLNFAAWQTLDMLATCARLKRGRKNLCGVGCGTGVSTATNSVGSIRLAATIWISFVRKRN